MKYLGHCVTGVLVATLAILFVSKTALGQDAPKVDSTHYKVEFENDQVRALRISYGPHEKSVMHEHPASVVVFLTDGRVKFTYPDGETEEVGWKAGETWWLPAAKHRPENITDKAFELIQVEMKAEQ